MENLQKKKEEILKLVGEYISDKATATNSADFIDSNSGNFLCHVMVIVILVVSLAVGLFCGPLYRWMFIGLMCLIGMFILGVCECFAFLFFHLKEFAEFSVILAGARETGGRCTS